MAGSGQAGGETATRLDATVRGLRAGAGASDAGARAAAPAGAALSPVPPRGHAAAADGACRPRAGRAWRDARRRSDRAKKKRALGRCPVPTSVPVAQAGPEGRPRCTRSGLRAVDPVDKARQRHALSVEVIGMVNLDMSADVDQRRGSRERTTRSETLCRRCGKRKALCSRDAGKRRANRKRHHDLCSRCRRALRDSTRNPML